MASLNDNYKIAVQMLIHEGSLTWNRYSVFLVAHSIVVAAIVAFTNKNPIAYLSEGLAVMGMFLCIIWTWLTAHGHHVCKEYKDRATDLQDNLYPDENNRVFTQKGGSIVPILAVVVVVPFNALYGYIWHEYTKDLRAPFISFSIIGFIALYYLLKKYEKKAKK